MRNLLMKVNYDGTHYDGFQTQPQGNTIQDRLEQAILHLTGEALKITASGRTDAGVHAYGQPFNFLTSSQIPLGRWCLALNARLPQDIVVTEAKEVPLSFHSRRGAKRKTYRYTINGNRFPDPFQRRWQHHHPLKLDVTAMQEGLAHLVGTYDYTSFASRKSTKTSHVRTIFEAHMEIDRSMCRPGSDDQGVIHTFITGSGFLQHMVRIIMGTLIQVGERKYHADKVADILAVCDRAAAGPTAVAKGLALWSVEYDEDNE
ncbi:tRNA pseudouridine synthase A [Paenibacillus sp. FSL R7-0273]|uniref:tRNA pseudouridine(38-40) synthase TruA n=1 Tax=Paenibacillus sp. FSL R7-0273 TaxID=1536772 RepID=UPI0004F7DA77|nr:tRNA pseudouridine(38-40) synthase TruA [Paenibacillus sp. FSL R7-0273]AIQ49540.1 tRNA pseudouridine synthase A [Paenibacillus sp. FSL R7-0273]OMF86023.1 tRNA pseudouridine(38-40) synthase TruA [Paenibacillus sp. FSL R7-0273]